MAGTDDISTLLVEFGRIIEKIDHITTDADDRALMKAHRFIAQAATALTEQAAQIERLTRERDEAIREMSGWATKAGEAEGRLKASEWHGVVEGWQERATTAERERDEARAEVERMKKQREELVIHITCTLAHYKALGWIEDDVPPNIEQAYAETFHLPRAALTKVLTTVRAEARKAALEEAVKLADERGAATTASAIRALIEKEG